MNDNSDADQVSDLLHWFFVLVLQNQFSRETDDVFRTSRNFGVWNQPLHIYLKKFFQKVLKLFEPFSLLLKRLEALLQILPRNDLVNRRCRFGLLDGNARVCL